MKRSIASLVILIFVLGCYGQKTIYTDKDYETLVKRKKAKCMIVSTARTDGQNGYEVKVFKLKGKKTQLIGTTYARNEVALKKEWQGECTWYFDEGGAMYSKGSYLNGKEGGEWIYYYKDADVMSKGKYWNGNTMGLWLNYYKDGGLSSRRFYDSLGEAHGMQAYYGEKEDTIPRYYSNYKHGKKHGPTTYYNNKNVLTLFQFYNMDSLDGKTQEFYNNGNLKSIEHYRDNGLVDTSVYYDSMGNLVCKEIFNGKNQLKLYEWYNSEGKIIKQGHDLTETNNWKSKEVTDAMMALSQYVKKTYVFPKKAMEDGIEEYLFVRFEVRNDGSIHVIKIETTNPRSRGYGFEEEARRALESYTGFPSLVHHNLTDTMKILVPISLRLN